MNNYQEIQNLYQKIINTTQYRKRTMGIFLQEMKSMPLIFKVIILGAIMPIYLVTLIALFDGHMLVFILVMLPFSILISTFTPLYPLFMQYYFSFVIDINKLLNKGVYSIETTEKILRKIYYINILFKFKFYRLLTEKAIKLQLQYFILLLTDLRSDLQLRLEEQQKTLEQAKSEVEANIH